MKRRLPTIAVLTLCLAGSVLLAARAFPRGEAAPALHASKVEITIDNFAFTNGEVTVDRGTEVTWLNRDDMPHTVVSTDKSFHSPALDTGDRYSHRFDQPGTFAYFCSIHPRMTGRIVVR